MYWDEKFYSYCTHCDAGFCSSALSSVHVEEVSYLSLLCAEDISGERNDEDNKRQAPGPSGRWDGTGTLLASTPCRTLQLTPFSLLLPPCFSPTVLSSEGWTLDSCSGVVLHLTTASRPSTHWSDQLGSLLRPRWNRLPALSAFKCSLTSRANCEKLTRRQPLSFSFCSLKTHPEGNKKISI